MRVSKRDLIVICACVVILLVFLVTGCVAVSVVKDNSTFILAYTPVEHLNVSFQQPKAYSTVQHFSTESSFGTTTDFDTDGNALLSEVMVTATGPNAELYHLCATYFDVYYGGENLSPILPMAIANVETPGRANFDVTWSALFPSKIVPVEEMYTFNVTTVISDPAYYKALSTEYSTRDRGCLQMSPTYGTGNKEINTLMSGTEVDKLRGVDTSKYKSWVSGASSSPGDRFYLPDVLLRMRSAMQQQCDYIAKNGYTPLNDFHLVSMCAMGHHNSGVWYYNNRSKAIGCWKSAGKAYEWSTLVSSQDMINVLYEYASVSSATYIDSSTAKKLLAKVSDANPMDYATKDIVCWYPIKALYAYIKLCTLYTY